MGLRFFVSFFFVLSFRRFFSICRYIVGYSVEGLFEVRGLVEGIIDFRRFVLVLTWVGLEREGRID